MTHDRRRSAARPVRRLALSGLLAVGLGASVLPGATLAGPTARAGAPAVDAASSGALHPSIQYEEAMAHEHDRIAFEPGSRVSVGFRPRATDRWAVGGRAPRALPAGRASGLAMREGPTAKAVTPPAEAPIDPTAAPAEPPVDAAPSASAPPDPSAPAESAVPAPVDLPTVDGATPATTTSFVASPQTDAVAASAPADLVRQVFGFLPYWEVSASSTTLNYDVLSTIAYFSVGSDTAGNLLKRNSDGSTTTGWGGWTSSKLTNVINAAHQRGTRVVLTITMFAWTSSQAANQAALLGNPTARLNLARQAAAAVRDRGADGINLDFEPIASGYADEFTAFVRTMRAELDRLAPGYQLTFDTTGYIGNYPLEDATAAGGADAIFIMGYDYRTAGTGTVGSIDPIAGPAYDLTETIAAYTARVPASRLILGVPYYGRAWSTDTDQLHAKNISGTKYGSSVTVVYDTAADYARQYGRRYDSLEQTPWVVYKRQNCTTTYGCVTPWRQIYYDDATSLRARYDLVNRTGLRGAGIWALGYDGTRPELYDALADKFLLPVDRIAGADRYGTSAAISAAVFPTGVPVAFVATGANFPDALSGAAAAGRLGGPVLLVGRDAIPPAVATELGRLRPGRIVVLGSTSVVSSQVATALGAYTGGGVTRLAGADRYATAAAISASTFAPGAPVAYVATGRNYPDALAGAAAAIKQGGPLLLVDRDTIPAAAAAELRRLRPGRIVVLGSTIAVSSAVATGLGAYTGGGVTRLAGADRYATAAAVSQAVFGSGVPVAYAATGLNFPDAMAGAAAAGAQGGPMLLVGSDAVPTVVATEVKRLDPARIVVLGSTSVISSAVPSLLRTAAKS